MTETDFEKSQSSSHKLWKIEKEKSFKNAIFEFYSQMFNFNKNKENSVVSQQILVATEATIWCLQIISLLWVPDMPITNWSNNKIIWEVIGYSKFDNTCSAIGIIEECFLLFFIFTYASFISVIILVIIIYYAYRIPAQVFSFFYYLFYIWSNFFIIPSIELFCIFLKYNFLYENKISEYENSKRLSDFVVNPIWKITIIFAIIILFVMMIFYTEFSAEIRHSASQTMLKAKAHSKLDAHISLFSFFFSIAYTILAENYIVYLHILAFIFSAILIKETLSFLPYFSYFCNTVIILRPFFIVLISFIFLLGRLMDNSLVISLLAFIFGPLLAIFTIQFSIKFQRNASKDMPKILIGINSQYELEKAVRYLLCSNDTEHKDEIIQIFENFFAEKGLNGNKLQAIWVVNYCLFTLRDESLAKIKLNKTKNIFDLSLETNFQEYLCNKNISNVCASQISQFSNYFLQFHIIKKVDQKLCINLFKFWNEITLAKPSLRKLKKGLNSINKAISDLNSKYSQICTKFPNSKESLALYASYSKDIIYDIEKSRLIEVKLKALDRSLSNPLNDSHIFSFFNDKNGILIISNETDNFGEILHCNQRLSEIFRLSKNKIISSNFFDFIDSYYEEKVKDGAKKFIKFSSVSEIDLSKGFFLRVDNKLLNFTGKLWVTSINGLLITIIIFKPKVNINEIALISDDGEIVSHSTNFSKFAGKSDFSLIGSKLKKLFFDSEYFDFEPYVPYRIKENSNEFLITLSYYEIYKVKIPYVMLIHDSEEIRKWENLKESDQNDERNLQVTKAKLPMKLTECDTFRTVNSFYKENQLEYYDSKMNFFTDEEEIEKNSLDNYDDEKSQISENSTQDKFLNILNSLGRSINILHFAFALSVIFIQIIIVLAVNIAVLAYAFANIKFISDMNLPVNIGKVGENFQRLALYAQILLYIPIFNTEDVYAEWQPSNKNYAKALSDLENNYENLMSNSWSWSACSSQSILEDENINLWSLEDWTIRRKENLISTITMFIKAVKNIQAKEFKRKIDDPSEIPWNLFRFLLFNGWGVALDYCNQSLIDIIECQKSMMAEFKSRMTLLLMLGPAVLVVCILIALPFYYSIFKIENTLWNSIRKKAFTNHYELKLRLKRANLKPEDLFSHQKSSMSPCTFKSYWRYAWRTLLYLAAVILFCLINITYFYEKCSQYLTERPAIIRDLIQIQILHTYLGVWSQQKGGETYGLGLWVQFPFADPFSHSEPIMNSAFIKIAEKNLEIRNSEFASNNFKSLLYEKNNEIESESFALGVYLAQGSWKFDVYIEGYGYPNIDFWVALMKNLKLIDEFYDSAIDEIDKYSQSVIDDQMVIIEAALVGFIACSLAAYFGFYLLFFRNEKIYLKEINSILKIMPSK